MPVRMIGKNKRDFHRRCFKSLHSKIGRPDVCITDPRDLVSSSKLVMLDIS